MEGVEYLYKENIGGNQYYNSDNEIGEMVDYLIKVNGYYEIIFISRMCDYLMIDFEIMGKNFDVLIILIGVIFFDL